MTARLSRNFLPDAVYFFPIVKRFAVDLVDGSLGDLHVARLPGHEEIDVVGLAIGCFHIDTGKIFSAADTREAIVMDPDQVERQIFAPVLDVELSIGGSLSLAADMLLDPSRDISLAHFLRLRLRLLAPAGRNLYCCRQTCHWRWMFCSKDRQRRRKEQRNRYCDNESCNHKLKMLKLLRFVRIKYILPRSPIVCEAKCLA